MTAPDEFSLEIYTQMAANADCYGYGYGDGNGNGIGFG